MEDGLRQFEVIVIGGGHAGAEAAWAAAGIGARVALVTLDRSKIGAMSCNPAIGGLAKGQIVREIDALGGLMGLAIDATGIQFRMLNRSKGPAVWGPRAQADKHAYAREVQRLLQTRPNITVLQGEVADIRVERDRVVGIRMTDGSTLDASAVIVTTGTFLRGLMHTGESKSEGGRVGEAASKTLSGCLARLGLRLGRLKTGTPPRLHRDSMDFSAFEPQPGDESPAPFSFLNEYSRDDRRGFWKPPLPQVNCWIGHTHEAVHELIRANLHRAPMYSGQIESTGPRYCPSIEDKVVRFAEKPSHQIFLEPEGLGVDEIYVNGISTSLPADVQEKLVRMIRGLEDARFIRYGYAVEYDMVWPDQVDATLQCKGVAGLFLAGQINGTSGYEEAAGQGLVAGVNAARLALGRPVDFVLGREQAYIGVLVDDLVTKPPTEPYRMFTSRAEHRLLLRGDNADQRLTAIGRQFGIVDDARWRAFEQRAGLIGRLESQVASLRCEGLSVAEWLRRPQVNWADMVARLPSLEAHPPGVGDLVATRLKYEGYVRRQSRQVERFSKLESKLIPAGIDYASVVGLRNEARQKLTQFTPRSLGQALRISGITPADVTLIAVHLERRKSVGSSGTLAD